MTPLKVDRSFTSNIEWFECLCTKVLIDITQGLVTSVKVNDSRKSSSFPNISYEKLGDICYRCALVNHLMDKCELNLPKPCFLKHTIKATCQTHYLNGSTYTTSLIILPLNNPPSLL